MDHMKITQLTVDEANNYAVPLIDSVIGRHTGIQTGQFEGDQDDLVDFWGVWKGKRLIGVIGIGSKMPGINRYYLGYFCVDPSFQRKGVGKALLTRLEVEIHSRHIERVVVETYDSEYFSAARSFYEANGFEHGGFLNDFLLDGTGIVFYSKYYRPEE